MWYKPWGQVRVVPEKARFLFGNAGEVIKCIHIHIFNTLRDVEFFLSGPDQAETIFRCLCVMRLVASCNENPPSLMRTGYLVAQPSSGGTALPLASSMAQLCKGQVIFQP